VTGFTTGFAGPAQARAHDLEAMPVALQSFLLRWLPLGLIVIVETTLLFPLRRSLSGGTTWGGFAVLVGVGLSIVLLIDWRSIGAERSGRVRLRIPDPNGKTIRGYLWELCFFALTIAPLILVPGRWGR